MGDTQQQYEKRYHERLFYREGKYTQRNQARLDRLRKYRQAGNLLEVGCATGGFLRLAAGFFEVQGIDISKHAVGLLAAEFGNRVQAADLEVDQLPVHQYDVVVAFNILEHLNKPGEAVEKLYHALRPGGVLFGSVPHNAGLIGGLVTRIGNTFDKTHVSTLPPEQWQRLFENSGFREVLFFGEIPMGRNRNLYLDGPSWQKVSFNLMFLCRKPGHETVFH